MSPQSTARDWQTRIRLWAAMVMGVYQLIYMGYFSSGLFSSEAMESYGNLLGPIWWLSYLNFLALIVHMSLGLWKLYKRNTLKMPWWETTQIGLGLLLPFVMIPNNLSNFAMTWVFGIVPNYVDSLLLTYPSMAWRYVALATLVGLHAQIGTHAVLRMRPWYPKVRLFIVLLFTLLPLASFLGYLNGGNTLYHAYQAGRLDPDDLPHVLTAAQKQVLNSVDWGTYAFFPALYLLLFSGRALRLLIHNKNHTVKVEYPDGGFVMVLPSTTVLEASRIGSRPHASICGGRGRCTTCRIRVDSGSENLSPVGEREQKALQRIGANTDIRLACQAEGLKGTIKVTPLLPPDFGSATARKENKDSVGRDVELAVMFADLRGFTQLSESKFPYDVVYILNSYFQDIGKVIQSNGGQVDKFIGDGVLAYFGLDKDSHTACLGAVKAAWQMVTNLTEVNQKLKHVLPEGLSVGIALHYGNLILGEIGFQDKKQLTIIGDTVNTTSRMEGLNKKVQSQLILSTTVAAKAGLDFSYLPLAKITLRGKTEPLRVYVVKDLLKEVKDPF